MKFQPRGSTSLFTLALFELTQQNVVTTDPNNPFFGVQTGEFSALVRKVFGGPVEEPADGPAFRRGHGSLRG